MIGYLDLPSGISGDMFLGCLIDAGWTIDQLRATLSRLRLPSQDWAVDARSVMKGSLRAMQVDVRVAEGPPPHQLVFAPHAHSHQHAHGQSDQHHNHDHHHHQHQHKHQHAHSHVHRNLHDIRRIIEASDLPRPVKDRSIAIFTRLAVAEAKVHGTNVEQIHFHEVGALDAIVDIVGAVMGLHELGIEKLYCSALPAGHGWIDCAHGKMPLPAPATLELMSAVGAPTRPAPGPGELLTPTGAAIVCELAQFAQPAMCLQRIAIGAGKKDFDWPNVARLWLGIEQTTDSAQAESPAPLVQIETNIDDMNPQLYAPLMDRLLAAGALDVWLTPVQMKKGRPGVVLAALARQTQRDTLVDAILRETTTLGVRCLPVHRCEADRQSASVMTEFGLISVKLKRWGGRVLGAMPEYEDCRKIAEQKRLPLRVVYDSALAAAHRQYLHDGARDLPDEPQNIQEGGRT
ncbi:MAG TPA: nickel pincer cofactor biosynthesis protein LarC [Tepidisphaeraceae bacterium]|nr:nickel pincer cofactor biosynthesis protein LarC [Tepidisphaeraceae bacterium]